MTKDIALKDVFLDFKLPDKPILVCGKGPSLDNIKKVSPEDLEEFFIIGINEVHDYAPVDMTFLIHSEHIYAGPIIIPYYPHVLTSVGPLSDVSHAYHYNLNTAPKFHNATPIIMQDGFTIHALLDVLGHLGVHTIRTLGIDGGHSYANILGGLSPYIIRTPKVDQGYDFQFRYILNLCDKYNFDYKPFEIQDTTKEKEFGNEAGHSQMILAANE